MLALMDARIQENNNFLPILMPIKLFINDFNKIEINNQ